MLDNLLSPPLSDPNNRDGCETSPLPQLPVMLFHPLSSSNTMPPFPMSLSSGATDIHPNIQNTQQVRITQLHIHLIKTLLVFYFGIKKNWFNYYHGTKQNRGGTPATVVQNHQIIQTLKFQTTMLQIFLNSYNTTMSLSPRVKRVWKWLRPCIWEK